MLADFFVNIERSEIFSLLQKAMYAHHTFNYALNGHIMTIRDCFLLIHEYNSVFTDCKHLFNVRLFTFTDAYKALNIYSNYPDNS